MAHKYEHPLISSLLVSIGDQAALWREKVETISGQVNTLAESPHMESEVIGKAKEYLQLTYPLISEMILTALGALDAVVNLYSNSYIELDGDYYAVIDQDELTDYSAKLNYYATDIPLIDRNITNALNNISDIVDIPYSGLSAYAELLQEKAQKIIDLNADITAIETDFQGTQTQKIRDTIAALEGMVNKALSVSNVRDFNPDFYVKSPEFQEAVNSYNALYDQLAENQEEIAEAYQANSDMFVQLQKDYEQRVKEAETAKIVTGVVAVVASVAVTVATGGAAAPLVMASVSAATGFASGAVNSYYDQRIGSVYCPGKVSAGKVFASGVGNAVISFGTSMLGAGAGHLTSKLTEGVASEVGKAAIKIGVNAGKDVIAGVGKRLINTSIETGSLKEGAKDAFSLKNILADGASSVVSGTVGEITSSCCTMNVNMEDTGLKRMGKTAFNGLIKETPKGISERFTETWIKEGDFSAAVKSGLDVNSIFLDSFTGVSSELVDDKVKRTRIQNKIDKEAQEHNEKQNKKLTSAEMEEREEAGIKTTKNKGTSYAECDEKIAKGKDGKAAATKLTPTESKREDKRAIYKQLTEEGVLTSENSKLVVNKHGKVSIYVKNESTGKMERCGVKYVDDYDLESNSLTVELVRQDPRGSEPSYAGGRSMYEKAVLLTEDYERVNPPLKVEDDNKETFFGKFTQSGEHNTDTNYVKTVEGAIGTMSGATKGVLEIREEHQEEVNRYNGGTFSQMRPRVQFDTGNAPG